MKTYEIEFIGRLNGALGITYKIVAQVEAPNQEAAILKLYEKYEHIMVQRVEVKD